MSNGTIKFNGEIDPSDGLKKGVADIFIENIMPKLVVEQPETDRQIDDLRKQVSSLRDETASLISRKPLDLIVKVGDGKKVDVGLSHKTFPKLIKVLSQHINVYLVGPAGSGKTYAAKKCAEALQVPFYFTGAIANEYKLTGFKNAQGEYVPTEFRKAYENGGVFLFDEIDASFPQAVLAFNAALANDFMDFPDKQVKKHKDFYCIAAANTIGQGADRQYVGRNQLDAASLDRFVFIDWEYDENLETALSGSPEWAHYVQKIRKAVSDSKMRCVISPRASIYGAALLRAGFDVSDVKEMVLWKGIDEATKSKLLNILKVEKEIKDKFAELKEQMEEDLLSNFSNYYGVPNSLRELANIIKKYNQKVRIVGNQRSISTARDWLHRISIAEDMVVEAVDEKRNNVTIELI